MENKNRNSLGTQRVLDWELDACNSLSGDEAWIIYRIQAENNESTCETCRRLDGQWFITNEVQIGKNFPPFHPNCRCQAQNLAGKQFLLWIDRYADMMQQCYGFTQEESELILKAYRLLYDEAARKNISRQERIHFVFSNLSALCDSYSGDAFRWWATAGNPSTADAKQHLVELGMSKTDVENLYKAMNRQHFSADKGKGKKDLAHEFIQYAIFSENSFKHNFLDGFIGNLNALGSYKGDVFSTRMEIDDMNSDLDATNIYNRMISDL